VTKIQKIGKKIKDTGVARTKETRAEIQEIEGIKIDSEAEEIEKVTREEM